MELETCEKHGTKYFYLNKDDKKYFLCRICMFNSEEEISFYNDNFDNFKVYSRVENLFYLENLKDYEGFVHINKIFKEKLESLKLSDELFEKLGANQERFRKELKEGLLNAYNSTTEKFEKTVTSLTEKTDKLDLTLKSAKDELQSIQKDLDEQIEILESEEKIQLIFEKVMKKYSSKARYLSLEKYIDPELKINFKRGGGNNNFRNGTNVIIATNRGGSYWCECSEDVFEGPLFARLRINNISRKSDWSLNIGLQRAESTNTNSYYQDGVFFMCSGKITVAFQGNQGRNCLRAWNNGDEVLIRRDENNVVYFGLNDETTLENVYNSVPGRMRLCVGFSSSMINDNIEIVEVEN